MQMNKVYEDMNVRVRKIDCPDGIHTLWNGLLNVPIISNAHIVKLCPEWQVGSELSSIWSVDT